MSNNVIKSIFPNQCPHCKKDILVAVQTMSPVISEIITEDDVKTAKEQVEKSAKELLTGDELKSTITWLHDENTLFGLHDVDSIIESFKK